MRRFLGVLVAVALAGGLAFTGSAQARIIGNEGCTPGYWKQKQHFDSWEEYKTTDTLGSVFTFPSALSSYNSVTFLDALNYQGGPGVDGAVRILMRQAVAAFLNAANEGLGYPYRRFNTPFDIQLQVNNALASQDRATMLALASVLDAANNLGCPLN